MASTCDLIGGLPQGPQDWNLIRGQGLVSTGGMEGEQNQADASPVDGWRSIGEPHVSNRTHSIESQKHHDNQTGDGSDERSGGEKVTTTDFSASSGKGSRGAKYH